MKSSSVVAVGVLAGGVEPTVSGTFFDVCVAPTRKDRCIWTGAFPEKECFSVCLHQTEILRASHLPPASPLAGN